MREVVALVLLSVASRKCIKALLPYCEANQVRYDANKIWLSITKDQYPLANTSFLQPAVLYYRRAVRTALSPIEGLKLSGCWQSRYQVQGQNSAKPD